MNELVFILPPFITAAIFFWVSFKFNTDDQRNIVFQIFFFIIALGFLMSGMAQQDEMSHIVSDVAHQNDPDFNDLHTLTQVGSATMIFTIVVSSGLLMVFLVQAYFKLSNDSMAGKKKSKWNRVLHQED